jgi:hypothetical protein
VQGAHLALRDCEASAAKLRNDNTAKTSTALVDLNERRHTPHQVNEHTALVGALLAICAAGQLSDGYDHDSFKRLKTKIDNCITSDKWRVVTQVSLYKASLVPSASADAAAGAKSTSRIAIVNWVELLFSERVTALEGTIRSNNFLRCNVAATRAPSSPPALTASRLHLDAPSASVRIRPASSPS